MLPLLVPPQQQAMMTCENVMLMFQVLQVQLTRIANVMEAQPDSTPHTLGKRQTNKNKQSRPRPHRRTVAPSQIQECTRPNQTNKQRNE
jgi:hypothetical protein